MKTITVQALVNAPVTHVWKCWTTPEDVPQWCFASDDWGAKDSVNDLRVGGSFKTTMFARDGSASFDFDGVYTCVELEKRIESTISDGRKVSVVFTETDGKTHITETFEMENIHTEEEQRTGWQAILDNFKTYAESST